MPNLALTLLDPANYSFRTIIRTRYSDTDRNDHINNVALADAFETGRVDFETMLAGPASWVGNVLLAAAYIDYLAESHFPGDLAIFLGVISVGRTSWTVGELAMQDDRPCAFCRATLVLRDQGDAMALPDAWRARLDGVLVKG